MTTESLEAAIAALRAAAPEIIAAIQETKERQDTNARCNTELLQLENKALETGDTHDLRRWRDAKLASVSRLRPNAGFMDRCWSANNKLNDLDRRVRNAALREASPELAALLEPIPAKGDWQRASALPEPPTDVAGGEGRPS